MTDLPLLLLLLALGARKAKCPPWPTASSPPPPPPPEAPLPAAMPPVDASPIDTTATPSKVPLQVPIPPIPRTPIRKPPAKPKPPVFKGQGGKFGGGGATATWAAPGPEMDVSVADIQKVLIKRGSAIAKDGLYGPKTAAAWTLMAKLHRLPPAIKRRTGKIARVATKTFTTLSGPVIP